MNRERLKGVAAAMAVVLALMWGLYLICGCATQDAPRNVVAESEQQMQAAAIIAPVLKASIDEIRAQAEIAAEKITTTATQAAGRDAINKTNIGTPWYSQAIQLGLILWWQWRNGYNPRNQSSRDRRRAAMPNESAPRR